MKTLRDIGEDALIERLVKLVPHGPDAASGPGDDCAVIDQGSPTLLLLKTDALVEHVHFLPDAPARSVGWKALCAMALAWITMSCSSSTSSGSGMLANSASKRSDALSATAWL